MKSVPIVRFLDRESGPHIFTLIALSAISALAMNIFLPSLPSMAEHFGTTGAIMGLSVGVYLAASAILQILTGPASDALGRRPVVLISLAVFIAATALAPFAPNATVFLILRAIQAASAVAMALSRAIVRDMVPGEQAGSRIAYVTMGMAIVPALSPMLGGLLDRYFGWQANFWVLATIGLMVFVLAWLDQGETAPAAGSGNGIRKQFREYPQLMRSVRFWGYCLASAFASGAFFAYLGGAPFVGDQVFHLEPQRLGVFFGTPAMGYFLGNFLAGRFSVRVGIDRMALIGLLTSCAALVVLLGLTFSGFSSPWLFFGFMALVGVGNGMTLPNANAGMLSVRPDLAGTASGLGGAIMIGGGAALSALAGLVLHEGTGETPLLWIMMLSSLAGLVFMLITIFRNREVAV